jgi:AbiU2
MADETDNPATSSASAESRVAAVVDTTPAHAPPTAAERLARLKTIVRHLSDTWPSVLQRQLCMQTLGRHEDLHAALAQTCAAHITNTLQNVLLLDLLREIGALVLDTDSSSASVGRALSALRDQEAMAVLRAEYEIVRPLTHLGGDITPEVQAEIDARWQETERGDQLAKFEQWRLELAAIGSQLFGTEVHTRLELARNKSVAHYDVVRQGSDWKLWRVDGTGLTWGQVNDYVDVCTKAIDTLSLLVLQTSFDFEESQQIAQKYVDEFVGALLIGLQEQRRLRDEKRERLLRGLDDENEDE